MRYIILMFFLITSLLATNKCENKLFTFRSGNNSNISLDSFLKSLAINTCGLNIVYKDKIVKQKLQNTKLDEIYVKDYTLNEFLDLLLTSNNLFYKIDKNKLEISYIKTKTFNIDYIPSTRVGSATFMASSSANTGDVNSIDSKYEFNFWDNLSKQLENILDPIKSNETNQTYTLQQPIIDKNSGLVTITGTKRQLDRVTKYINKLNERLHKQIIIDVKIYAVDLSNANQTGINWSNLNFSIGTLDTPLQTTVNTSHLVGSQSIFNNAVFNVSGLLNFLATQGNVSSISNPKIATINNQKAIISVGDTINYRVMTKGASIDANGNQIPATYQEQSKFVGILLDITPEISDNGVIMLRINPTISSFRDEAQLTDPNRQLAPDTTDNKLSTVVRIRDGQTLILGGLITNKDSFNENGVPVLKEIPVIKYLFSSKSKISTRRELVFVVTPHILDLNKKKTIQDLGF